MKSTYMSLCFIGLLTSCSLEPGYRRPCMEMPQSWRIEASDESTCCNVRWWEELQDPILDALVVQALENNKDLKTAIWRVSEFYGYYQIASSKLYPQIESDGMALKERIPEQASFLPEGFSPITPYYKYEFSLSYEIDLWGKIHSQSRAACEELLAQVENQKTVVLSLISAVAQTYLFIRELDQELKISNATLRDREEYVVLARKRFEGGLTSEIEVEQAISVLEEVRAIIATLEAQIPVQENLLSVLLGTSPTCILRGKEITQFSLPPVIPAGLPSDLLERRPDIMAAENRLIAANARIGVARAAFFPQISLTGLFGQESLQLKDLFTAPSIAWAIGGQYAQAIFTGGRLVGQLNATVSEQRELLYQYEQTILTAFKEVNDALVTHRQSKKLVDIETQRVAALVEYLKLAWLRYYEGQADYLTVLDAETKLLSSELDLTKAQGDVFITLVDIYKSLGGGWVIEANNSVYPNSCQ